jgi:hypothetical protein
MDYFGHGLIDFEVIGLVFLYYLGKKHFTKPSTIIRSIISIEKPIMPWPKNSL